MKFKKSALYGALAGSITGLLGTGGGMILVPCLTKAEEFREEEVFPASVAIILPLSIFSLAVSAVNAPLPWQEALPYCIGGVIGGIFAGRIGTRLPLKWLHRILGILIFWGGLRYLWQ